MSTNLSKLADELKPYFVPWVRRIAQGNGGGSGGGGTPDMLAHVLATTSTLGTYHTVAGLTAGQVLKALGPTSAAFGVLSHTLLSDLLTGDPHTQYALRSIDLTAGAGLTGGGTLAGNRTFTVGAGLGITVNADDVALTTPGSLTVSTTNDSTGNHTHAITASADVSAGTTALLKSNAGVLGLRKITSTDTLDFDSATDRVRLLANNRIGTDNYASQVTGWAIDYLGAADFRYVYTDELHAKALIADLEQALAGGQIISKSVAVLHQAFTLPVAGGVAYFVMRDLPSAPGMQVFPNGDIVRFRKFSRSGGGLTIANAWGAVTLNTGYGTAGFDAATSTQGYRFDRSAAPNAGSATGDMAADAIVLDYGTTGNGFYEVNAIDGIYALNSPYAQTVTWTTHPATGQTVRTRTGNLRGIFAIADEYGLYAGGGVTDADVYLRVSNAGARFNNIGVFMYNGGINTGLWQPDGTLLLSAANVATAADRALEFVAGAGTLRIGKTGTNKANLYWDGTALHLRQNTTPVITLASDGTSYFAGAMSLGASGGIYQGTGTFASPTTGLKIWNDTGIGRLAGYSAGVLQAGFNSSGQITAGAGAVTLDVNGISIGLPAAYSWITSYAFRLSGTNVGGLQAQGDATTTNILLLTENLSGRDAMVALSASGATGRVYLIANNASGQSTLSLDYPAVGGATATFDTNLLRILGATEFGGTLNTTTGTALEIKQAGTSILKSDKTSADAYLELGAGRTVDGAAYIDLIGDTTYTDYGARLVRYTGANGATVFSHRGTGVLRFATTEAAAFQVYTGGAHRFEISATGDVGIGTVPTAGAGALQVLGLLRTGDASKASFAPRNTFTIAADATVSLGTDTFAWGWLMNITDQTMTQITLRGTTDLVNLNNTNGAFTTVAGTANNINVYNSANVYYIQNKYAATRTLALFLFYAQ